MGIGIRHAAVKISMKAPVIHSRLLIKRSGKTRYLFEYFNEHYLHVNEHHKDHEIDYVVDLAVLKPESHTEMTIPWNWLILSAMAIGVFVGLLTHLYFHLSSPLFTWVGPFIFGIQFPDTKVLTLGPIVAVLLVFIVLSLREFIRAADRKLVFLSRYASFPIVQIPMDSGAKASFYRFVQELEHQISQSLSKRRIPDEVLQAGEMKTLRRLCTLGVLSKNQYNTVKNRIFKKLDNLGSP